MKKAFVEPKLEISMFEYEELMTVSTPGIDTDDGLGIPEIEGGEDMQIMKKIVFIACLILLTGCSDTSKNSSGDKVEDNRDMAEEVEVEDGYDVPEINIEMEEQYLYMECQKKQRC